jgi:hypothetical protein
MLQSVSSVYEQIVRRLGKRNALLPNLVAVQLEEYQERLLSKPRYADPRNLNRFERQVFSQFGEDGIIEEIFRRIGTQSRTFLEIGVGDGLESNTALLLLKGWTGYWIDGDRRQMQAIRKHFRDPMSKGELRVLCRHMTTENAVTAIRELQVPAELDLMSLDIDRNTYWLWAALEQLRPRAVVVEYNAFIPPDIDWKVEYDARRLWNGTTYFGASLKAYELLGKQLDYHLVGCTLSGVNAFFVRSDLCGDLFERPFTSEQHFEPMRLFLESTRRHPLGFSD